MIKIIDCIDEIVDKCFGDPELKGILEFSVNANNVTVKDQFLHHYEKACYLGTKDSLIRAILYRTHNQQDLLLRLSDYKKNLSKILVIGEYSKVKMSYKEELGSETSIGASGSKTISDNKQVDNYSGLDVNNSIGINDNRTGSSQTNRLETLKDVIPQPTITADAEPIQIKQFQLEDGTSTETTINYTQYKLNNPQYDESKEKIGYQNLTKDITTNHNNDTNITTSSKDGKSFGKTNTSSGNTTVKGNKSDVHDTVTEFITNDARVKLWSRELPRLKTKFWNSFFSLFVYEQV